MGTPETISLRASDVSRQKSATVGDVPTDATVGELVQELLGTMNLPQNDASGRPLTYQPLLEREGRRLHSSEVIGQALQDEDQLVLQPNIDAGLR